MEVQKDTLSSPEVHQGKGLRFILYFLFFCTLLALTAEMLALIIMLLMNAMASNQLLGYTSVLAFGFLSWIGLIGSFFVSPMLALLYLIARKKLSAAFHKKILIALCVNLQAFAVLVYILFFS